MPLVPGTAARDTASDIVPGLDHGPDHDTGRPRARRLAAAIAAAGPEQSRAVVFDDSAMEA